MGGMYSPHMKLDCCFVGESQMSALLRCFSFGGTTALSPGSGYGEAGHGNSLYCLPPRSLFVHLPQYGRAGARKDFICLWPQLEESQFGKRQGVSFLPRQQTDTRLGSSHKERGRRVGRRGSEKCAWRGTQAKGLTQESPSPGYLGMFLLFLLYHTAL